MLKNKLIQSLNNLSRKEMTRFNELAQSPYYNKHKDVRQLVAYLNKIFPHFTEKRCNRFTIFKKLFPKAKHNQQRLFLVFTYTQRLFEQFLIQEQLQMDNLLQTRLLVNAYKAKKQLNHLEKKLKTLEEELEEEQQHNSNYFYLCYELANEQDSYNILATIKEDRNFLEEKQQYLDCFFLIEKLRDVCEAKVRKTIGQRETVISMLNPILETLKTNLKYCETVPLILFYTQLYELLQSAQQEQYFVVKNTLKQHETHFPKSELRNIYNYLQNYCISQVNTGSRPFLEELFHLYQQQLHQGFLTEDARLFEWHYKNIVTVGLRVGETQWVGDFIQNYKDELHDTVRENAFCFNLASYYYAVQKYSEVLGLLMQIDAKSIQYILGSKTLLLRTFYELNEEEAALSLAKSFKQLLHRNKELPAARVAAFTNFIKFTRKAILIKSKMGYADKGQVESDLGKLQEAFEKEKTVINRQWLENKIAELAKRGE